MRIFHVCADPGIAPDGTKGASAHLRHLAAALVGDGHDVVTFSARLPAGEGAFPAPLQPLRSRGSLLDAAGRRGPPDVVYERYSLGHLDGLAAARALGRPFVLEVNAPLVLEAARHRRGSLLPEHAAAEARLFREADLAVAVSEPLRRHVADVRGTDEGTAVVRNGCDPRLFPRPAPLAADPPVLAFLGHPKPWHGADRLPGVLAVLAGRGLRARLVVVGGGRGAEAVRRAAAREGVGELVDVTGPLDASAAARALAGATVAVAPYPSEAFFYFCPLKVIESMAAGLPVVTTDQGDLAEIVGDGGVLVSPGDDRGLEAAVARLLEDRELARSVGRRARARALGELTWGRVVRQLEARIDRVLVETGSTAA